MPAQVKSGRRLLKVASYKMLVASSNNQKKIEMGGDADAFQLSRKLSQVFTAGFRRNSALRFALAANPFGRGGKPWQRTGLFKTVSALSPR
jgi:hypothetical protein